MPQNPILDELRRTREAMLADAGGTVAGLVAVLQDHERCSGRRVLSVDELPRNRGGGRRVGEAGRALTEKAA